MAPTPEPVFRHFGPRNRRRRGGRGNGTGIDSPWGRKGQVRSAGNGNRDGGGGGLGSRVREADEEEEAREEKEVDEKNIIY